MQLVFNWSGDTVVKELFFGNVKVCTQFTQAILMYDPKNPYKLSYISEQFLTCVVERNCQTK